MERLEIGTIYLVTNDEGMSYLDGDFNWYVDLNDEEKERFKSGLLAIQGALFDSIARNEDVFESNDENKIADEIERLQNEIDRLKGLKGE